MWHRVWVSRDPSELLNGFIYSPLCGLSQSCIPSRHSAWQKVLRKYLLHKVNIKMFTVSVAVWRQSSLCPAQPWCGDEGFRSDPSKNLLWLASGGRDLASSWGEEGRPVEEVEIWGCVWVEKRKGDRVPQQVCDLTLITLGKFWHNLYFDSSCPSHLIHSTWNR